MLMLTADEPFTYKEVAKSKKWMDAMVVEIELIEKN